MGLGPARIHPQQHPGPVVGLGAAGAGVHFQIGVVAVGLAGQQGFQFGASGAFLHGAQLFTSLLEGGLVALFVGHFSQHDALFQGAFQFTDAVDLGFQTRAIAADGLGLFRVVPKGRIFDPSVQLIQFSKRDIPVKDAS